MEWLKEWFLQRTSGTCGFVLLRAIWDGKRGWWWAKTSASLCFLVAGNFHRKASVIMVDELLSAYPHQLSFSEAGLRIMITSHFPPKTRLSMASRMLINEVRLFSCSPLFLYLSHSEFALARGSIQVKMDLYEFSWIPVCIFPSSILLTMSALNHLLLSVPVEILVEKVSSHYVVMLPVALAHSRCLQPWSDLMLTWLIL